MKAKLVSCTAFLVVCLLAAVATTNLAAQTVTGTLSGRVLDKSGAIMPQIKVAIKNEQTGATREVTTNNEGYFLAPFLNIGTYEVTVAAVGFKTIVKKGVAIELNKNTVSDFTMEVSSVTTVVEVSGEQPLIETTVGELKHSLDLTAIENTPLAGRNFISLVEQIPGFQNAPWIGSSNNPTNSTGSYAVFSGTGSRSATFQIDGVNNDDSSENQNRQNVNISAIREFQVLTNAFSAEFGRAGGAVVLVQTKSGSNSFHGDAYDYIQNDIFNANGFFGNAAGRNAAGVALIPRQRVRRNQYGWTIGGPVFPNKLFFFHSGERTSNLTSSTFTRFFFFPSELTARQCNENNPADPLDDELPRPRGPYCVPLRDGLGRIVHPNITQDIARLQSFLDLYKAPLVANATANNASACADLINSGRPNRCITISGLPNKLPQSDYSGKLDWNAPWNTVMALRYQYSRQKTETSRIIFGDNFGRTNNRQYNIGLTATKVFGNNQTGEFRYGFGNRTTLQDVTDGNTIPIIRFASTLAAANPIIGTSANVPINRRQHDHQFVYNHTLVLGRQTLRAGIDQRFSLLDDIASATHRGFWTFGSPDSTSCITNPSQATCTAINATTGFPAGYTGWENLLRGFFTAFQRGFGPDYAESRYGETNIYIQDDYRVRPNLTLNLGFRWEGVRSPKEARDRFEYGFGNDFNNYEPRIGFAWTPNWSTGWLGWLSGGPTNFVVRGGYGLYHGRIFQSVFSQSGLNFRAQPPNGFFFSFVAGSTCATNSIDGRHQVDDPTCGFMFTPGAATRSVPVTCSLASDADGCLGVRVAENRLGTTLLLPDPNLQSPYVQQWNLTLERKMPWKMAVQVGYNGNRGIGSAFFDGLNQAAFPITSPVVTVDVGGGNFQPVVFDRVCVDFTVAVCNNNLSLTGFSPTTSGSLRNFAALTSTSASLAEKGIVIEGGVPHGYISFTQPRTNERRPDALFGRNVALTNFGWSYYNALNVKVTKQTSNGLNFSGFWTWSKAIDTGSEATFTGVDTNSPSGKGNAARSLRGLSGFHAEHRVVLNYGYEFPWFKTQTNWYSRAFGGWMISGITTFQSGNPFTVSAGYDVNLDGNGNDRPGLAFPEIGFTSIDNGRAQSPCPVTTVPCPNTVSEIQMSGALFIPRQSQVGVGDQRLVDAGGDGSGTIGRNTFFSHGLNNFDVVVAKSTNIREGMSVQLRMEWYNLFNRVTFGVPTTTLNSTTPVGRITAQRNPANFVNSARDNGSRMGQLAIRFIF